jgi:hypothetical protein
MNIKALKSYDEIAQSFDVFCELRHHLTNKGVFAPQVMQQEGCEIIVIKEQEEILACIGFRFLTTLA